jgi:uncharacterized membrane protein HdeD (DUF308 family)
MVSERLPSRLVLGLRAVLALFLGLTGLFMVLLAALLPRATVALIFVQPFIGFIVLDGLLCLIAAIRAARVHASKVLLLLAGLLDLAVAVAAIMLIPRVSEHGVTFLPLVAAWAIVLGLLELAWAKTARVLRGRPMLMATAGLSLAFGVFVYLSPPRDPMTTVWRFAVYFLLLGILRLLVTFRVQASLADPGEAAAVP